MKGLQGVNTFCMYDMILKLLHLKRKLKLFVPLLECLLTTSKLFNERAAHRSPILATVDDRTAELPSS